MVGVGGRGRGLTENFAKLADAHISYLVDVDQASLERASKTLEPLQKAKPAFVSDMRRALDDKSVDAIVVATPDHWHGPATILGCDAGKHVYVEKPASHNVREGRLMIHAARRNKRIVQVGTQSRSRPSSIRGVEYAKSGKIGKIVGAKAWDVQLRDDIGHKEDGPAPRDSITTPGWDRRRGFPSTRIASTTNGTGTGTSEPETQATTALTS